MLIPDLQGLPVLIASHKTLTQSALDTIGPARAADFYGFSGFTKHRKQNMLAIGKLALELGKICNFTAKAVDFKDIHKGRVIEDEFLATVMPSVVPSTITQYYPLKNNKMSVYLSETRFFNFLYCDIDRNLQTTNLQLLLQPFQTICWFMIILNVIILPLFTMGNSKNQDYFRVFLMTFAVLFLQVVSNSGYNRSKLFILWIFGCIVLSNLYSGVLTSLLISPLKKEVMESVSDLVGRGYHLVYTEDGMFEYLIFMVKHMEPVTAIESGLSSVAVKKTPLATLVDSIVLRPTLSEMIKSLAFQPKTAVFGPYPLAMRFWAILSEENKVRNKNTKNRMEHRSCHIGKHLSSGYAHPEMWIFKVQGDSAKNIPRVFTILQSNGIHAFWISMFTQMQVSPRVQDNYRFKSITEVKEDVPIDSLGFHNGSTSIIFILFGIGILFCWIVFVGEVIVFHVRRSVKIINCIVRKFYGNS